jgi:transposase
MEKQYPTKYPSDVSDEEWAFVAPYLTLCREDAPQREHALRAVFNGLRYIVRTGNQWRFMPGDLPPWTAVYQQTQRWMRAGVFEILVEDVRSLLREFAGRKPQPTAMIVDSRTLQSTPESGARAGYDGAKRRKGSKVHAAVDTLGHLLALHVTAASEQDRARAAGRRGPTDHRPQRGVGLCRSGLHGPDRSRRGGSARHPVAGRQTHRGKARLRPAAKKMGRRAKLRLGRSFPPPRQRL